MKTTDPLATAADWPEGSRWLHVFTVPSPGVPMLALSIQVETVGVRISAAPYVVVTPQEAKTILAVFKTVKGAKGDEASTSIPLDPPE